MNKKNLLITVIIGFILLINFSCINNTKPKDSSYYLTSPWVTERVDWYFLQLPKKWTENFSEIERGKEKYKEICNDFRMYEINLNDFHFMCTYMDAKEGVYENWDLDQSATAILNQVFYNLKCKDINVEKLSPFDNYQEINYTASSDL